MTEPTLFDFAVGVTTLQAKLLCHKDGPDTSRQAAQKMVETGEADLQRDEVYRAILRYCKTKKTTNFTARELADFTKKSVKLSHITYIVIQRRKHEIHQIKETDKKRIGYKVWKLISS